MKPVLTVFIDSVKPESIKYMPFLNSFSVKRRMKTELGYSLTCHSSFYTGTYPNKHQVWFFWKCSPNSSPFRWIRRFRIDKFPHNKYTKFACFVATKLFNRNRYLFGVIPFYHVTFWGIWHTPIRYWPYLDPTEYQQTIFDILEANNTEFEVKYNAQQSSGVIEKYRSILIKPWTYIFIGDIDPLTHVYGQDSAPTQERLREIDKTLERIYRSFEKELGDFYFICFSDHGQSEVKDKIDLYSFFKSQGVPLNNYIHFVDSTFARFWFRNENERQEVVRVLTEMGDKGVILTEEHFKKYNVNMPDNRYGDLIFHLDLPHIFDPGNLKVMGTQFSVSAVAMHGYLPDYPETDGFFIANKEVVDGSHVELVDIMPSVLRALDIEVPDNIDGKVLWK